MSANGSLIEEQAIAWTIRARDPDFDDWDALTEWLEADSAHNAAFQKLALLDDILPELMPAPTKRPWRQAIFQRPHFTRKQPRAINGGMPKLPLNHSRSGTTSIHCRIVFLPVH